MNIERNDLIESLNAALAESFEGLAFIEFDLWAEVQEIPKSADKHYSTSIDITDPFTSKISLVCSKQFILNTIESITGEEASDNESEISDTLKELLNTVAGRFMVKLLSESAEFDFGIPDFQTLKDESFNTNESDIVLKFDYDEESVFCVYGPV